MTMKCPSCKANLRPFSNAGQTIEVCPKCEGMWFDSGEIRTSAEDLISNDLVENQDINDAYDPKPQKPYNEVEKHCPCCGEKTSVFNYAYDSNVFLNRCPSCSGIWADKGELQGVAKYLKGHPVVNRYAERLAKGKRGIPGPKLLYSKPLSGGLALLYIVVTSFSGNPETTGRMVGIVFLALACIWFSGAIGNYTGLLPQPAITKKSPPCAIALTGWFLLMTPIIIGLIIAFSG